MKILSLPLLLVTVVVLTGSCKKEKGPTYEDKQLVLQPGSDIGQDCLVAARQSDGDLYASSNHSPNPDVAAIAWTYDLDGAGIGINRTYIKFTEMSAIASDAVIKSAKLYLYGVEAGVAAPIGNSYYPGSPYAHYGDNACWLKRVTGSWSEDAITWNNKPGTTEEDKASVAASTSQWNYDAPAIDVTNMVKAMVASGENNGFCLQLQTEEIYRGVVFGSSEHTEESKRPKLVIDYTVKIK